MSAGETCEHRWREVTTHDDVAGQFCRVDQVVCDECGTEARPPAFTPMERPPTTWRPDDGDDA